MFIISESADARTQVCNAIHRATKFIALYIIVTIYGAIKCMHKQSQ